MSDENNSFSSFSLVRISLSRNIRLPLAYVAFWKLKWLTSLVVLCPARCCMLQDWRLDIRVSLSNEPRRQDVPYLPYEAQDSSIGYESYVLFETVLSKLFYETAPTTRRLSGRQSGGFFCYAISFTSRNPACLLMISSSPAPEC